MKDILMPTSQEQKAEGWDSLTEILDYFAEPKLVSWKVKVGLREANRISRLTAKTGTRVHQLIHKDWKEGAYKLAKADSYEVKSCMQGWEQFKKDHAPVITAMEFEEKNEDMKILCHPDMQLGSELVELKTSGFIKPKHWIQLGTQKCTMLHNGNQVSKTSVLRLDRNIGTYEYLSKQLEVCICHSSLLDIFRFCRSANGTEKEEHEYVYRDPDSSQVK